MSKMKQEFVICKDEKESAYKTESNSISLHIWQRVIVSKDLLLGFNIAGIDKDFIIWGD